MFRVFQITWLTMKERKETRSDFRADLQKAYNHCIAWDGLWAAISQEPPVKLLQWYNGEFLAQELRVFILSEVLAPFDLNKGLRQRDTWLPTGRSPRLHTVVLGNQCHCCFRTSLQQLFLYANSAKIRMKEFKINIMMSRDLKTNGTWD